MIIYTTLTIDITPKFTTIANTTVDGGFVSSCGIIMYNKPAL